MKENFISFDHGVSIRSLATQTFMVFLAVMRTASRGDFFNRFRNMSFLIATRIFLFDGC